MNNCPNKNSSLEERNVKNGNLKKKSYVNPFSKNLLMANNQSITVRYGHNSPSLSIPHIFLRQSPKKLFLNFNHWLEKL